MSHHFQLCSAFDPSTFNRSRILTGVESYVQVLWWTMTYGPVEGNERYPMRYTPLQVSLNATIFDEVYPIVPLDEMISDEAHSQSWFPFDEMISDEVCSQTIAWMQRYPMRHMPHHNPFLDAMVSDKAYSKL
ncbi:hypothetical protein CEXT_495721 [Caerostris extrusa]|uniref:Uncharacterized protein n=1 Tax=Caerostris extrusa TaxID=172846 RepID=A0AAV4TLD8_CAEEX|nr:hypothetical protein CEXT_495721 [Caerostris extrusa]